MKNNFKVVIVDDHPVFSAILGDLLEKSTHFTVCGIAQNATEALQLCAQNDPNLVLLDMVMPGMSGLELISIIKGQHPKTVVCVVSGLASPELIHAVFAAGADRYLSKSSSIDELLGTISTLPLGKSELTATEARGLRLAILDRKINKQIHPRDLEVLRLYSEDMPIKEIAAHTGHSVSSVYKTLTKIKQRLGLKTKSDLRDTAHRLSLRAMQPPIVNQEPPYQTLRN